MINEHLKQYQQKLNEFMLHIHEKQEQSLIDDIHEEMYRVGLGSIFKDIRFRLQTLDHEKRTQLIEQIVFTLRTRDMYLITETTHHQPTARKGNHPHSVIVTEPLPDLNLVIKTGKEVIELGLDPKEIYESMMERIKTG